ncbi:hypothetical protein BDP27DRAFT_1255514 [Rhodocollybia butyracea]|uniref:Uncharacterized protein n=1 Tax=Rhodocollybia butyracea TaxID=206335 RepID=A0A9P5Q847_9AGAR|nr:hypothetical protein BDP27DRAFT_1255514 [Rhodocollybia butyracea]
MPPTNRLVAYDLIHALTRTSRTTNFRHLLPAPKHLGENLQASQYTANFSPETVPVKDRIKWWNIVPGDQIRVIGDENSVIHQVTAINKLRNRVYVRDETAPQKDPRGAKEKEFHYSSCQLFLGKHELPLKPGQTERREVPVFAQRIGTSPPVWNTFLRRWVWERFATKTTPVLLESRKERIPIPWPKEKAPTHSDATIYDTSKEEVSKVTYKPPPFNRTLREPLPRVPTESEFLRAMYNPSYTPSFSGSQPPVEQYLFRELSNPHSRAKKMKRWQTAQRAKRDLLNQYMDEELKHLNGRTRGEARAEAAFKWRQALAKDSKARRIMRWIRLGGQARFEKKIRRKVRKEEKKKQRLAAMVLTEEPNQIIPKDLVV